MTLEILHGYCNKCYLARFKMRQMKQFYIVSVYNGNVNNGVFQISVTL